MIPLPFTVPIWLIGIAFALWIIFKLYELFVEKPQERRQRQTRKDEF